MSVNKYGDKEDELVDELLDIGLSEDIILVIVTICLNEGVTKNMLEYIKSEKDINAKKIVDKVIELTGDKYRVTEYE